MGKQQKLLKIVLNINFSKTEISYFEVHKLKVESFSPLALQDLLSSPLVSSVNSSPILNDTS